MNLIDLTKSQKVVRWSHVKDQRQSIKIETYGVMPTPFDSVRANEIWAKRTTIFTEVDKFMTDGEIAFVRAVWDILPGTSCWNDAFQLIRENKISVAEPI